MRHLLILTAFFCSLNPVHALEPWTEIGEEIGVEPELLYAIAIAESKKYVGDGVVKPWPWTVNSSEGGKWFDNKDEMVNYIDTLIAKGRRNIDIGIMQVNWHWNGERLVGDHRKLADPEVSIHTGARVLKEELVRHKGNIVKSIAAYHNNNAALGYPYAIRVYAYYNHIKKSGIFQ